MVVFKVPAMQANNKTNQMVEENDGENPPQTERDNGCVLACIGLFLGSTWGAISGAFMLSLLQYLFYVYFKPDILKDGQWGMVFLATVPIGGLVGCVSGAITGFLISRKA
jgi:hypothetical protein